MSRLIFEANADLFTLNRISLINFFDKKYPNNILGSPLTAIISFFGEDLLLGLFDHYLRSRGYCIVSLDYSCKSEGLTGHRLDAWVKTKNKPKTLYQTEIKNWSANALGGKPINNKENSLLDAAKHNRQRYLNNTETAKKVWKVLLEINPPKWHTKTNITSLPLLVFWSPIAPQKDIHSEDFLEPFFKSKREILKR